MVDFPLGVDTRILNGAEVLVPENACKKYERCQNIVPGRGEICGEHLDEAQMYG